MSNRDYNKQFFQIFSIMIIFTLTDYCGKNSSTSSLTSSSGNDAPAINSQLDTSFGTGGIVKSAVGSNPRLNATAIQSDGKIVVAGLTYDNFGYMDFIVVRYNTDGSLDTGFGTSGVVTTDIGTMDDEASSVAIQSDGKIVVAGYFDNSANGVLGDLDFAIVRYNTDGSLDSTFNAAAGVGTGAGIATFDSGTKMDHIRSLVIQIDGKIVAAGYADNQDPVMPSSDFVVLRYMNDGTLDAGFGTGGMVMTDFDVMNGSIDYANSVALQSDGKIAVSGSSDNGSVAFALARYTTTGILDNTFGTNGLVRTNIGTVEDIIYSLAIQSDGKILAGGTTWTGTVGNGTNLDFALVRYLNDGITDGAIDTGFGTNGIVTTTFGSTQDYLNAMTLQANGKIIAAGSRSNNLTYSDYALVKFNATGSLDSGFGTYGKVTTNIGTAWSGANAIVTQSDGKIVAAGNSFNGGNSEIVLVRYLP